MRITLTGETGSQNPASNAWLRDSAAAARDETSLLPLGGGFLFVNRQDESSH